MSIRLRLTIWYGAALAAVLVLGGALIWFQLGRDLRSSLEDALQVQATDVGAGFEDDSNVSLAVRDPGRPGVFTTIYSNTGSVERATLNAPTLAMPPATGASEVSINGHSYSVYTVRASDGSLIVAGESLAEVNRAVDGLAKVLLVVAGVAGVAALLGGWWLAGRALAPTATLGRELAAIGVDGPGQRVTQPGQPDEVGRLAAAINAMLARIDEGMKRQSAFVAAASHDLRTPIAALRMELELAERGFSTPEELAQRSGLRTVTPFAWATWQTTSWRLPRPNPAGGNCCASRSPHGPWSRRVWPTS